MILKLKLAYKIPVIPNIPKSMGQTTQIVIQWVCIYVSGVKLDFEHFRGNLEMFPEKRSLTF